MLTYSFEGKGKDSLYEYLYKQIKNDILAYKLSPGEKLPSKRAFAKHLNISTITVENAYIQLLAEGYIYSVPKSGYYVSDISSTKTIEEKRPTKYANERITEDKVFADFTSNSTSKDSFPFTTWTKILRQIMSDYERELMVRSPYAGIELLRVAISDYLYQFRGMSVEPEQIVIGAGTEYLYGMLIQLLGRDKRYAVEDPGYQKITRIYQANQVDCCHIPMDNNGVNMQALEKSEADILHISPSHHFPTGIVTPVSRRYELLSWVAKDRERYIIEDDYDSEFRLVGKPIPSLQSIDVADKVIYMNTFSKSLSSTIRISYMVLPKSLVALYKKRLGFYSCTVPNFEQYTLYRFIEQGHLEKHINRMRNYYRIQRDKILECIKNEKNYNKVEILEENSGLHFLMKVHTDLSDEELILKAKENGVAISCLSQYSYLEENATEHTIIINYSGIKTEIIPEAVSRLFESLWDK
ncbi:MAG: PLP-dependent aminotransferase family protein [Lachnospiraceae bacterium]|nr:PLP-dependent aminotransferase family protein [Lachnospiraceae bacterium]